MAFPEQTKISKMETEFSMTMWAPWPAGVLLLRSVAHTEVQQFYTGSLLFCMEGVVEKV